MKSPCKDCTRRKLGCHNVDTCQDWREYVERNEQLKNIRGEIARTGNDWEQHLRRHGCRTPKK